MRLPSPFERSLQTSRESVTSARDEHPPIVLHDIAKQRRPGGHTIAFANEKGGVGKSTLAFHCALALAHLGKRVLTIDCDRRQQTLHRLLESRDATARTLGVSLPRPKHVVLDTQSGAALLQEMERLGRDCDFILIDLAGQDSPTARRAIALADTVVTPVNSSPADLNALGSVNPVGNALRRLGPFVEVVVGLREERASHNGAPFDWVVVKNRVRHCERRLIASAETTLATMPRHVGFRLICGLTERLTYRELLNFGLSHLDLRLIPGLTRPRTSHSHELLEFIEGLNLPPTHPLRRPVSHPTPVAARTSPRIVQRYRDALLAATPTRVATLKKSN